MSAKLITEIDDSVRRNVTWQLLPIHLKQVLGNNAKIYEKHVFKYSLINQLRFKGNLVSTLFRCEQKYYEVLIETCISSLCIFPYHLADIITKGLRVTPYNYYIRVLCMLLSNDKSYDMIPNFTAIDCMRILGIGRNEYLALVNEFKTNMSKRFRYQSVSDLLPSFPKAIHFDSWWKIEIGYVLESDITMLGHSERIFLDDLIDFGSHVAGQVDVSTAYTLYRKGLIYFDVPISGEDKISIPTLKNFIMNRTSGDYFENTMYKIFVSADENMTVSELAGVLQIQLDSVKHAISLFCRLGLAIRQSNGILDLPLHASWSVRHQIPVPYNHSENHTLNINQTNLRSDSIASLQSPIKEVKTPLNELVGESSNDEISPTKSAPEMDPPSNATTKSEKRIAFLFDSTLTAFLMMGNLSPNLKSHAVTMFEVGKLCDESIDSLLEELEQISLMDAEEEGDVSRYFTHAVLLRSTVIALRKINDCGLDLLRLECLENLDQKSRDRLLDKKYKLIVSSAPLSNPTANIFKIPSLGQFYHGSKNAKLWAKMFYYHFSGYGPPTLFLKKGTLLKTLPRIFLGYVKLLVTISNADPYVINSDKFKSINEQLKNDCALIQAYGINHKTPSQFEPFPLLGVKPKHAAIANLEKVLNFRNTCGYITYINTGVRDFGCSQLDEDIKLFKYNDKRRSISNANVDYKEDTNHPLDLNVPKNDEVDISTDQTKDISDSDQLSVDLDNQGEVWTILDIDFGVPLFDIDCNTRICEEIIQSLSGEHNLQMLTEVNNKMNDKYLWFISKCQYFDDETMDTIRVGKFIPNPRINLIFENGKVSSWNEK